MKIFERDVSRVMAYLALGILDAISYGAAPAEIGIWTLARPISHDPVADLLPPDLLEVIQTLDEVDGPTRDGPTRDAQARLIRDLQDRLRAFIAQLDEPQFYLRWE
jgi:hypothetical protein